MDTAKLMTGAMNAALWDAQSSGTQAPARRGSQGNQDSPVLKLEAAPAPIQKPSIERIEAMRDAINKSARNRLQIDRAGDTGRFIYRMLDPDTGETMRQWPPDSYLDLVAYLNDRRGGLVDRSA